MSHQQGEKLDNTPSAMTNESAMLSRAAIEPSAFAAMYDHYFPRVYNYVRYRVQDVDIADEITSQVFERTLSKIGSYRPKIAPFGAWLFAIARNTIRDHYRSTRRHPWFSLEALSSQGSSDPLPDEAVENKDTSAMLLWAVHQLPPREQDIIALKFTSKLGNKEIANMIGLSESNVGVILLRALRQLRKLLNDMEDSHG